jgi:DNA-binding transcriptional ArsR family regulator
MDMKDIFYITTLDQLRVISDPLRVKILWSLSDQAKTGKMLADAMHLSPAKIRYHLMELERVGLIKLVRTKLKNGIQQKFYQSVAINISLEKVASLINGETVPQLDDMLRENANCALDQLRRGIARSSAHRDDFLLIPYRVELTAKERQELAEKIKTVYRFMKDCNKRKMRENGKNYYALLSLFPTDR